MLDLPLAYLHRPAGAGVSPPWLLVLMHGVGSNEQDLFGLAPYVPAPFHVLSLRAPYRMGPTAHAWFDFAVAPDGTRSINEPQEIRSRALVGQTVDAAARQLGIPAARVVAGGFSQGGIMALTLLLTRPELLRASMVWHSRLLAQALAHAAPATALTGRQLWVSHGVQDNVIPLPNAHAIRDHARALPLTLTYREYPGMHEIRPEELRDSMAWLQGLTAAPAAD